MKRPSGDNGKDSTPKTDEKFYTVRNTAYRSKLQIARHRQIETKKPLKLGAYMQSIDACRHWETGVYYSHSIVAGGLPEIS